MQQDKKEPDNVVPFRAQFAPFRRIKMSMLHVSNRAGVIENLGVALEQAIMMEVDLMDVHPDVIAAISNLHSCLAKERVRNVDPKKPRYGLKALAETVEPALESEEQTPEHETAATEEEQREAAR